MLRTRYNVLLNNLPNVSGAIQTDHVVTFTCKYWKLLKESDWNQYHIAKTTKGFDSILDHVLVDDPDFSDLDTLTKQIEKGTVEFIRDVEGFLTKH